MIFIATSAPMERPEYRKDLLECLCYPEGHKARLSYRVKWIERSILSRSIDSKGLPAIIVFCDDAGNNKEFDFYPLRHVRLLGFEPRDVIDSEQYDDNTYITVRLELNSFILISPKEANHRFNNWHGYFTKLVHRPRPMRHVEESLSNFVFNGEFKDSNTEISQNTSWRVLVDALSNSRTLEGCFFFRITTVECRYRKLFGMEVKLEHKDSSDRKTYLIRTPGTCNVGLTWYTRGSTVPQAKLSTDSANLIGPLADSFGRHTEGKLIIKAKRIFDEDLVSLSIFPPKETRETEGTKGAHATLLFLFKPPWWLLPIVVTLLAFGALLTGINGNAIKDITYCGTWLYDHASGLAWILKALGTFLVGLGGYFGFRRLP